MHYLSQLSANIECVHKTDDFGAMVSASKEPAITGILRVLGKRDFGTGKKVSKQTGKDSPRDYDWKINGKN